MRSASSEERFIAEVLNTTERKMFRALRKEFGRINEIAFQALVVAAKVGARVHFEKGSKNDEIMYLRALNDVHKFVKEVGQSSLSGGGTLSPEADKDRELYEEMANS